MEVNMEDKIISVLNNVRTNLSNELETKRKELVKPFDDFADRLSAVEVTPLKIRGLSIEEIDNNFVNISVEILENMYNVVIQEKRRMLLSKEFNQDLKNKGFKENENLKNNEDRFTFLTFLNSDY